MEKIIITDLLNVKDTSLVYRLKSVENEWFYNQRTNRNIGWISNEEQEIIQNSVVGIAGCGGIGGNTTVNLLRTGVGTLKIADNDTFEVTNINRQYGSGKKTLGKSKAFALAKEMRTISEDFNLEIYPMGITKKSVSVFVENCDLICDEIDYWCCYSKYILHKEAQKQKKIILSANSVGHRTNLMCFQANGHNIFESKSFVEEKLDYLETSFLDNTLTKEEERNYQKYLFEILVDTLPDYGLNNMKKNIKEEVLNKMKNEKVAPIIGTNPLVASGILSTQVIYYLLGRNSFFKEVEHYKNNPIRLSFDALTF